MSEAVTLQLRAILCERKLMARSANRLSNCRARRLFMISASETTKESPSAARVM